MGVFTYVALDKSGRNRRGIVESDSARTARQQLREEGLIPLKISDVSGQESAAGRASSVRWWQARGISPQELALVTRQMATLIRSSLPVEEALLTAAEQNANERIRKVLMSVRARVLEGRTLAEGLRQFPHIFPEIFQATVAAGEQSGHLDAVLERLADYAENRQLVHQKISLALVYPLLLVTMSVLIVAGLLVYVVPEIVTVFQNLGHRLPLLTRGLIALSDVVRQDGLVLIIILGALIVTARRAYRIPRVRSRVHRTLLRIPLIGRVVRGLNTARFTRTLSILSGSGVPVLDALRISGQVVTNLPMKAAVGEATERVREGRSLASALQRSGLFPPMMIHLIASGEASGQLDALLVRAAENQERELESLVGTFLSILEPVMILLMGGVVLTIVLAILLPIFELNRLIH
jgi:general secretion pathway protein F